VVSCCVNRSGGRSQMWTEAVLGHGHYLLVQWELVKAVLHEQSRWPIQFFCLAWISPSASPRGILDVYKPLSVGRRRRVVQPWSSLTLLAAAGTSRRSRPAWSGVHGTLLPGWCPPAGGLRVAVGGTGRPAQVVALAGGAVCWHVGCRMGGGVMTWDRGVIWPAVVFFWRGRL
jgi:hypothetical protein